MTKIEWTDVTWNPVRGCSRVSAGCEHCYAERQAFRFRGPGLPYEGLVHAGSDGKPHWTGKVVLDEAKLLEPLHWRTPRRVFVNSMSDLFHEALTDAQIDRVFAVMALCPQHTFQVLTKRATRMREYFAEPLHTRRIERAMGVVATQTPDWVGVAAWPLPNVWLGVSAEDQATADARIPELLATPAAVRYVSLEPLLGAVDVERWVRGQREAGPAGATYGVPAPRLDWVIVGGESGPGARPMHPDWPRQVRDQCAAAGVAFFFKQWGAFAQLDMGTCEVPDIRFIGIDGSDQTHTAIDAYPPGTQGMARVGKRAAGRLLDGRLHDAYPERP